MSYSQIVSLVLHHLQLTRNTFFHCSFSPEGGRMEKRRMMLCDDCVMRSAIIYQYGHIWLYIACGHVVFPESNGRSDNIVKSLICLMLIVSVSETLDDIVEKHRYFLFETSISLKTWWLFELRFLRP
jgi:hypothetical protein